MKKEKIIWSVVVAAVLIMSGYLYYQNRVLEKELTAKNELRLGLLKENFYLKNSVDELKKQSEKDQELSKGAIVSLKKAGLSDPVNDLKTDLMKHPELIPYDGVLGGRMGFYSENNIRLINNWAFAYFEDGHICGYMVLEYKVSSGGKIIWKVLYSKLEGGE